MTDKTPLMADGLLGWPGFGQGGSQQWKAQRLYTGDLWYAPKSGFYFITGSGAGGGAIASQITLSTPGASLVHCPIFFPEGTGGIVVVGLGISGGDGQDTSIGDALILGGGKTSISPTQPANATIRGWAITNMGYVPRGVQGQSAGGAGGVKESDLTGDVLDSILKQSFGMTLPVSGGAGESWGGACVDNTSGALAGGNGGLIIAWV